MERIGVTLILSLSTLVITRVDSQLSHSYVQYEDQQDPRELRNPTSSSSTSIEYPMHGKKQFYNKKVNISFPQFAQNGTKKL